MKKSINEAALGFEQRRRRPKLKNHMRKYHMEEIMKLTQYKPRLTKDDTLVIGVAKVVEKFLKNV